MIPHSFADSLGAKLEETLNRLSELRERRALVLHFPKLRQCIAEVSVRIGEQGSPPVPPLQQRIDAFEKLRRVSADSREMTLHDWRLIAWGLADESEKQGRAIEDGKLFPTIAAKFEGMVNSGGLNRPIWFGLASSYFSHRPELETGLRQWERLRTLLQKGFESLRRKQKSSRNWMSVLEQQIDVFSASPGKRLGLALAEGRMQEVDDFRHTLQVQPESWLWQTVIETQLQQLMSLEDPAFIARIEPTLHLAGIFPGAGDAILAALLQRYAQTRQSEQAHKALKDAALERWGSPQLGSARNRWSVNVAEPVCKMVMCWFAKEDLETFFKLLQGESGVDQDRLDYWLRFVGQIGYSRIVLGASASKDQSSDFIEFRKKNAQRISSLRGGTAEDNAFMMKIGALLVVEFSRKGNACYIRMETQLPFKVEQNFFDLNGDLKDRSANPRRLSHTPPNRGWWGRFDQFMNEAGVYPDADEGAKRNPSLNRAENPLGPYSRGQDKDVDALIRQAMQYVESCFINCETMDHRTRGGAFWIKLKGISPEMGKKLEALGFCFASRLGYWIK